MWTIQPQLKQQSMKKSEYKIGEKVHYYWEIDKKIHSGAVERVFDSVIIVGNHGILRKWVDRDFDKLLAKVKQTFPD